MAKKKSTMYLLTRLRVWVRNNAHKGLRTQSPPLLPISCRLSKDGGGQSNPSPGNRCDPSIVKPELGFKE
ncbi:hypothetical protein CEXT_400321 [Caerostris extrusa]|uniref:Uncharacterized protein n=1 Tax=Caerostris extrusa TaxID=172846 RepID=A0AAV4Q920_CAEEX|nr:hypothetical protein CEXT_400321 [Caerostris extrusa]